MSLSKALIVTSLAILLSLPCFKTEAEPSDASVYEVTDVGSDVTADSAVHARDQALSQAQKTALQQLFQRLGADPNLAAAMSDDDVATFVQSFEVQNERRSPVRYIGTFTVQFRPSAVRNFLNARNVSYIDTRSRPVVVLPVTLAKGHPMLWEEKTKWMAAWEAAGRSGGLVPVVVPSGGMDDISVISTEEAVSGNTNAIEAIIGKYQAAGALVAVLNGDMTKAGSPLTVELQRFDPAGHSVSDVSMILAVPSDANAMDPLLTQTVKQAREELEKAWKQNPHEASIEASGDLTAGSSYGMASSPQTNSAMTAGATPQASAGLPSGHLPVSVPIASIADWEKIRQRLERIPNVARTEVVMLARGMANIEIEFRGDIPELQAALQQQNLALQQNPANSAWILQPMAGNGTY